MTKRATLAVAACLAACALSAPTASASLVNRTVEKCEVDAKWQVTLDFAGDSYVDITADSRPTGCKAFDVFVANDGNFRIQSYDTGHFWTTRFDLIGAGVTGVPAFAGVAKFQNGPDLGPVEFANGTALHATLTAVSPDGYHSVAEYVGTTSCGTNCYQTRGTYENGHYPGP